MNSIHIKLERDEAINIKRNALILEKELLETIKYIKAYNALRKREFLIKAKIKKDFALLTSAIQHIQSILPIEELGYVKKDLKQVISHAVKKSPQTIEKRQTDIDRELQEIKEKLARLG